MGHKKFHLGYFSKFGPPAWALDTDKTIGADWSDGSYHIELAKSLEKAMFDFVFFEDTVTVGEAYGGSMELDLKHAVYAPKHDPIPLLPLMAHATRHIGMIATASTTFYPPFLLARLLSTVDSLTRGRVGWNVVTSSEMPAARNFGLDELPPHETRYESADEYLELLQALWESWEEGALIRDVESRTHVDFTKVHAINFEGRFHKSRGPLNTLRSPQVRPVIAQAGASTTGRAFAAKHADVIVGLTTVGVPEMRAFREDIRARMVEFGRNPDDCKIMYLAPLHFATGVEKTQQQLDDAFEYGMVMRSASMDIDFSKYDLDAPVDQTMSAGGHTSALEAIKAEGRKGRTLREAVQITGSRRHINLSGTPDEVAEKMMALMDEVGGDGILVEGGGFASHIDTLVNELIPTLQRAGAVRSEYNGSTLRENLREF